MIRENCSSFYEGKYLFLKGVNVMDKTIVITGGTTITEKEFKQLTGLASIGATVIWGVALYGTCKAIEAIATVARNRKK